MSEDARITVIGAGPVGCMVALLLAQRGLSLRVFESRKDWREKKVEDKETENAEASPFGKLTNAAARSINLALSHRGITALKKVGLFDRVKDQLIPMKSRAVHDGLGNLDLQPYGTDEQAIYSVSRARLNDLLLDELQKHAQVEVIFGSKLKMIDAQGEATFVGDNGMRAYKTKFVIGADGAYSATRSSMLRLMRMNFSQFYISHGYKELTMPPVNGDYALKNHEALHIWPRHEFMLIALPNPDKSFTCTLFAPFEGEDGLDTLTTPERVNTYFNKYFADAVPLMPTLVDDCLHHPSSALITIRCQPWNYKDKIVLIGDAAHAVVPFYGQGMNSGFEDAVVFDEVWEKCHGVSEQAIPLFSDVRQPTGNAIADLSLQNYVEMRSHTAMPWFKMKKTLDLLLHKIYPTWVPLYTMVAFTRTPYHHAIAKAKKQDRALVGMLLGVGAAAVYGLTKLVPLALSHYKNYTSTHNNTTTKP